MALGTLLELYLAGAPKLGITVWASYLHGLSSPLSLKYLRLVGIRPGPRGFKPPTRDR